MQGTTLVLAGATLAGIGLSLWPFGDSPDLPRLIRLEPAPFAHRLDGDWQRNGWPVDAPVETVTIPASVEIMALPVSVAEWLQCVADGACTLPGGPVDRAELPVTGVNWNDATAYARWMSDRTGDTWRLPTDLE